jgi:hypothetical protein
MIIGPERNRHVQPYCGNVNQNINLLMISAIVTISPNPELRGNRHIALMNFYFNSSIDRVYFEKK